LKVAFCTPSLAGPIKPYLNALEASIPLITGAGFEECYVQEVGSPYISHARATMTRKALDAKADIIVYLDYDLSWKPEDLLRLVQNEDDVCAGLYRFKKAEEAYMGTIFTGADGRPVVRNDGLIKAEWVPAGFLKVTAGVIDKLMGAFPELVYGPRFHPSFDLFNHGAHKGLWYGEDYAFSRRWNELGDIWVLPDLDIAHHSPTEAYPGNYHEFLLRQPGGGNEGN